MKFLIFLLFANSFADPIPSNEKILEVGTILSNNLKSGKCAEDFFRLGKCFAPHELIVDRFRETANVKTLFNPAIMRKVVDIVRNVSTCLGNVTCEDAKFVKYSADAAVFIGERIYGDAFHCLINMDVLETLRSCRNFDYEERPPSQQETLTPREIHEITITPMFECFLDKVEMGPTSCTLSRRMDIRQAARALSELIYTHTSYNNNLPTIYEFNPLY